MKQAQRSLHIAAAVALLAMAATTGAYAQYTVTLSPPSLSFTAQAGEGVKVGVVSVSTSTGASGSFTTSQSEGSGAWLLGIFPASGASLPGSFQIYVNPAGVPAGTYSGQIAINAAGATGLVTIPVTLTVGTASTSTLSATPSPMAFEYTLGAAAPEKKALLVTSAVTTFFSATASSAGNWLSVSPTSQITSGSPLSANLEVTVSPAGLAAGTYSGNITLTPLQPSGAALTVPVNLTVRAAPQLAVNKSPVVITFQRGTTTPRVQTLRVTSGGTQLLYTAEFLPAAGLQQFLTVTPSFGFTPADLSLEVIATFNPPPGVYEGTLRISSSGATNSPLNVPVRYFVSDQPFAVATPDSLEFNMQFGAAPPEAKTLSLTSTNPALQVAFIASPIVSGVNWLTVNPASATTPSTVTVSVSSLASQLPPGTYEAKIAVRTGTPSGPEVDIPVKLTISNVPALIVTPETLTFNFQTGRAAPQPQQVNASSSGVPQTFNVSVETAAGGNWLSALASTTPATTPASIIVGVNPTGLASNTTYTGAVKLTPTAAGGAEVRVPVTFRVSDSALLNVQPGVLRVSIPQGAAGRTEQLQLTSTAPEQPLSYTVSFQTTPAGQAWLSARPPSGSTAGVVFVDFFPQGLSMGVYRGTVTITPSNAPAQTVPVELTITSGATLSLAPNLLEFGQAQGGAAPAAQNISVTASGANPVTYSASITYRETATGWLTADPASGTTPGTIRVSANGASLAQGTYTADVTVSAPGASNSPQSVRVVLTVRPPQTLAASQTSLTFNYQVGGATPAPQAVQLTSTPGNLNFTAEASTESGGNWLTVTPAAGSTPANLSLGINTTGLSPGQVHRGRVRIVSASATNSPIDVIVTLNVAATPVPSFTSVRNGASYVPGAVSPGEIIYIEGANMGPATLTLASVSPGGAFPTVLAETRVLFDGVAAPLIYVRNNALSAVVPYGIAGRTTTRLEIEYRGSKSNAIDFNVAETKPGVFTLNSQGFGQGAIVNQTGVVNGPPGLIAGLATAPAPRGSAVLIYITGGGLTSPAVADGRANPASEPLARLNRPVSVTIGGVPAQVQFAGGSPGYIAGFIQINAVVPENAPAGNSVPVVVQVGGVASQSNVTMAIAP